MFAARTRKCRRLCDLLGLDALVYTRCNRSGKTVFWSESPDGSRILTLVPGHYAEDFGGTYAAKRAADRKSVAESCKRDFKQASHDAGGRAGFDSRRPGRLRARTGAAREPDRIS